MHIDLTSRNHWHSNVRLKYTTHPEKYIALYYKYIRLFLQEKHANSTLDQIEHHIDQQVPLYQQKLEIQSYLLILWTATINQNISNTTACHVQAFLHVVRSD